MPADDQVVAAVELDQWLESLEDWPVDEVRAELRRWKRENPSRRPNDGHILKALKDRRGQQWVAMIKGDGGAA